MEDPARTTEDAMRRTDNTSGLNLNQRKQRRNEKTERIIAKLFKPRTQQQGTTKCSNRRKCYRATNNTKRNEADNMRTCYELMGRDVIK